MSNFVYDLTTLPGSKTDLVPTPPGADLSKYLPAAHWNEHIQASYDVRAALRTGVFQGLAEQASDPAPSDADAYWWLQNTGVMRLVGPTAFHFGGTITAAEPTLSTHLATRNYVDTHASISPLTAKGDLYTRTATVDARFPVGTAGQLLSVNLSTTTGLEWIAPPTTVKTLQGAYTDGGAGPQVIALSASGKGILIRDTLAGLGEALFAVQNSTGITSHFAVNSDGTVTMAGALTVTGVVIGATPTLSTHLTTKGYVDGLLTGLSWKAMVKYASTVAGGNVTLSGDQAIDGFTTTELDRVLLKNQTNHVENGIWVAHTGAAWTRAIDLPAGADAATTACFVDLGTLNQDTSWFCYTDKPLDIVGTDAIDFQVFSNTISMHNALTGLDGGTSGQYYHLTSAEHVGLHNIATGGVTFASATGVLATDASNFFWDNSNKRLGIGTATPSCQLDVVSATAGATNGIVTKNTNSTGSSSVVCLQHDGLAGCSFGIGNSGYSADTVLQNRGFIITTNTKDFVIAKSTAGVASLIGIFKGSTSRFGLGTDAPDTLLDVRGDVQIKTTTISNMVLTSTGNGSTGRALLQLLRNSGTEVGWDFGTNVDLSGNDKFTIRDVTGPVSRLTIQHDGKIILNGDLNITGALGYYSYTAGETLAQYDVVYAYCEGGTSGRLKKATNAAESTSRVVGVVVTGNTAGNAATIVMAGVYKMTFTGTAPAIADFGKPVYLSATAGAVTLTAPGAGTVLLRVGYLVGIGATAEVSIHVGDEFQQ